MGFPNHPSHDLSKPTASGLAGTAPADPDAEESVRAGDAAALRVALGFLMARNNAGEPKCERLTTGIGSCFTRADYTADARYGIDQACASCIAYYALNGKAIPTGAGAHAHEGDGIPASTLLVGFDNPLPEPMQPGWDPTRPGREAEARFLDACIAEGVDPADFDRNPDDRDQF